MIEVPADLMRRVSGRAPDAFGSGAIDGDAWLAGLPRLVESLLAEWELTVAGPARNGHSALVLPVSRGPEQLMLKVSWPHFEADHEHLALRHWAGRGAVRLIAARPGGHALLLEALDPARDLSEVWIDEACEVIGGLLARLHVPAPPTVPPFAEVAGRWLAPLRGTPATVPRRWAQRALEVFDELSYEPSLLHVDLHYGNVLAPLDARELWLAIDPHPLAGPRAFDLYPALRNRADELGTGAALRWSVRHRLEVLCAAAGIDTHEAREWCVVHAVLNAQQFAEEGWPTLTTLNLAIAKALAEP